MSVTLKALGIVVVAILLAAAPAVAEPNPGQGDGPIAFPGFKFGPIVLQGSGLHVVDQTGKVVEASGTGTVTNFPYLGDGTYSYLGHSGCFEFNICFQPGHLLGTFTVTSPLGSYGFLLDCRLTLSGGTCGLGGPAVGGAGGTGTAAGVDGFATAHLSWTNHLFVHSESGFIVPVLTKTTEAR